MNNILKKTFSSKTIVSLFLTLSTIIFFLFLFLNSFYPTLFVDESLYVGAALKVLSGDLFLRDYWFDKPFMQFFWIIPGILFMGNNIIGFSFSGIIASVWAHIKLSKIIEQKRTLFSILIALLFISNPFHIKYFSSAMAEPFLFISFTFIVTHYFQFLRTQNKKFLRYSYIWFALSFCVKQSTFMWAPIYAIVFLLPQLSFKHIKNEILFFLKSTRWIWFIAFIYQASNTSKFAAITWFRKLANQKDPKTLLEHISFWPQNLFNTQRSTLLAIFIISVFIIYIGYIIYQARKHNFKWKKLESYSYKSFDAINTDIVVFILPTILHFIGFTLANAAHYERYMFIFNLQLYLCVIRFAYLQNKRTNICLSVIALIILIFNLSQFEKEELDTQALKGRHLRQSKYLLPPNSNVHTSLKWHMFPLEFEYFLDACMKPRCLQYFGRNLKINDHQFLIDRSKDFNIVKIIPSWNEEKLITQKTSKNIWELLHRKLRLGSDMKIKNIRQVSKLSKSEHFNLLKDSETWEVIYGNQNLSLRLNIHFLITPGSLNQNYIETTFGQPSQLWFSAHVSEAVITINEFDLDIFTLFEALYKTYTIQLELINYKNLPTEKIDFVSTEDSSFIKFSILNYSQRKNNE